jgi:hypothetical protein
MTSTLSTLIRDNPCAFALIGAVARKYPSSRAISAWEAKVAMQAEEETYTEDQVSQCMRAMETHELGYLRQDAGNGDFGFVWSVLPIIAYELLRTGQPAIPHGFVRIKIDDGDVDEWPTMLAVHKFQLRPNCAVTLELPGNLTRKEVKKINQFLKALVQDDFDDSDDGSAWDDPNIFNRAEDDFPDFDSSDDDVDVLADSPLDSEVDALKVEEDENFLLPMSAMEDPLFQPTLLLKRKKVKKHKLAKA